MVRRRRAPRLRLPSGLDRARRVDLDLTLAVIATSLLRRHLGYHLWRVVHWGTWAAWPLAIAHSLAMGSDTSGGWGLGLCLVCVAVVAAALAWRVFGRPPREAAGSLTHHLAPASAARAARPPAPSVPAGRGPIRAPAAFTTTAISDTRRSR